MHSKIKRPVYADMFELTAGDCVQPADIELIIEVQGNFTTYGEAVKCGAGKRAIYGFRQDVMGRLKT